MGFVAADLDAVTIDAYGTLVELDEPVPRLAATLRERGVERTDDEVAAGLQAEIAFYSEHKLEGRDPASLRDLRERCAAVFLEGAGVAELDGASFAGPFGDGLVFAVIDGVEGALRELRSLGLVLAVVSNWDGGLAEHLERARLGHWFAEVVTAAAEGVAKPDPRLYRIALERLGVDPSRALHVGDEPVYDEDGARAAGMQFAPAPLASVVEKLA
ncbi:MAG: HAD-IA family hydrolase [Actinomycetota bacterium]|nr:HAD-IA family hydrolase [Actinomycetota bacterium]